MRLFGRKHSHRVITAGTDTVIAAFPIPSGGTFNNVHLDMHLLGPEQTLALSAVMYGMAAFVVPVPDPDAGTTFQVLWDNLIPKDIDSASGVFDLDTGATDTTPEFEMGEPDWSGIFDLTALNPKEIMRRRRLMTVATQMANYEALSAAPDVWTPAEHVSMKIGRKVRVSSPSVVMIGFSSPSLDETNQTEPAMPTEQQWVLLQYLEITLEQAFMFLIGLIETGAETPYVESAGFIAGLIEDDAFEATAGAFAPVTWNVFTGATFDISVPGRKKQSVLTSE